MLMLTTIKDFQKILSPEEGYISDQRGAVMAWGLLHRRLEDIWQTRHCAFEWVDDVIDVEPKERMVNSCDLGTSHGQTNPKNQNLHEN